jgi:hypothetical protein
MSPEQKDAAARASAAVLKHLNHGVEWVVTHKESSVTGKWDTGGVSGDQARSLTRQALEGEDDMPLNKDDKDWLAQMVENKIDAAWKKKQSNEESRSENLNTAGNVRKIVREELEAAGLVDPPDPR